MVVTRRIGPLAPQPERPIWRVSSEIRFDMGTSTESSRLESPICHCLFLPWKKKTFHVNKTAWADSPNWPSMFLFPGIESSGEISYATLKQIVASEHLKHSWFVSGLRDFCMATSINPCRLVGGIKWTRPLFQKHYNHSSRGPNYLEVNTYKHSTSFQVNTHLQLV